jgi:hypothetical protein
VLEVRSGIAHGGPQLVIGMRRWHVYFLFVTLRCGEAGTVGVGFEGSLACGERRGLKTLPGHTGMLLRWPCSCCRINLGSECSSGWRRGQCCSSGSRFRRLSLRYKALLMRLWRWSCHPKLENCTCPARQEMPAVRCSRLGMRRFENSPWQLKRSCAPVLD